MAVFTKIAHSRSRAQAPAVWAATLANIGAALKEKGAAAKDAAFLHQALEAFDQALQVFAELDLESNAKVVEVQRGRVLSLLATYKV